MDFNIDKAKEVYEKEFEKGKKVAKEMENEKDIDVKEEDPYEKLEKLADLKAKGIISEEEFAEKKKRILSDL